MNAPVNVIIRGTGSCLPERTVPNTAFANVVESADEWIFSRTGIRERRYVGPGESSASLGVIAARRALGAAGLAASELDVIICGTVTPQTMTPANAGRIQAALGCRPIPAFDVSAACSGFLYALAIGDQFLRGGGAKHALVIGTETLSRVLNRADRDSCVLFGDGAGAAILSISNRARSGVRAINLGADGTRPELIEVPAAAGPGTPDGPPPFIRMQGREVFRQAVQRLSELVRQAITDQQEQGEAIDLLIPHQVNQRIIAAVLDATGFPADKVFLNLCRYGNTAAASIPIALDEAIRTGRARSGDTVLSVAFGGGLTWGSCLLAI